MPAAIAAQYLASLATIVALGAGISLRAPGRVAPWRRSYMVEDDRPRLLVRRVECGDDGALRYAISDGPPGAEVTLTLLDHHGDALSAPARTTIPGAAVVCFAPTAPNAPEAVHVALRTVEGRHYDWTLSAYGSAYESPDEPEE